MKTRKVCLEGCGVFWFLQHDDGSGPLAPLEQCDDEGKLDYLRCFKSDTFAHVMINGEIRRYGRVIGNINELITLTEPPGEPSCHQKKL